MGGYRWDGKGTVADWVVGLAAGLMGVVLFGSAESVVCSCVVTERISTMYEYVLNSIGGVARVLQR